MLRANVLEQPQDDRAVEVVSAQVRVAVRGQDLEDPVLDPQDGDVERPAAEVVDRDQALANALEAVGQRRRGRLVDDAHDIEAGDATGVLGRLTLAVVEVRGHRDDGLFDRLAEVSLGALLERLEHDRRDLRGCDLAVAHLDLHDALGRHHRERQVGQLLLDVVVAPAHQPLHGIDGRLGAAHELSLRGGAHQDALARERDDRGQEHLPVSIGDHPGQPRLLVDVRDQAVGGAEINADDARHNPPVILRAPGRCRR